MKIVIIFAGLMVQVNQPWSFVTTAVLPNAMSTHTAALVIPTAMLANADEAESLGEVVNGHLVVPLEGARVTVEGTTGFRTRRTQEYEEAVPRLGRVAAACDKPRRPVRDRTPDSQLAAYFDYRGGTLSPDTFLQNRLSFADAGWEGCAVCGAAWTADLRGDTAALVIKRAAGEKKIVVRGSADGSNRVLLRNSPNQLTDGSHFVHTYDLFDGCAQRPIPGETQACGSSPCDVNTYNWERAGNEAERATWPASDCTITDYP